MNNNTDIQPEWHIIKVNELPYWDKKVQDKVDKAYGVYAFDRKLAVHICSYQGNYEMHRIGTELHPKSDELTEEELEFFSDAETEGDAVSEPVSYYGIQDIESAIEENPALCKEVADLDPDELPEDDIREGWCTGSLTF